MAWQPETITEMVSFTPILSQGEVQNVDALREAVATFAGYAETQHPVQPNGISEPPELERIANRMMRLARHMDSDQVIVLGFKAKSPYWGATTKLAGYENIEPRSAPEPDPGQGHGNGNNDED